MQARKEDRRAARPWRQELKKAAQGSTSFVGVTSADATNTATTIVTNGGHTMTISDLVTHFDEAANRRLNRMNQKLMRLEMQMEVLEAEMNKANDLSKWS